MKPNPALNKTKRDRLVLSLCAVHKNKHKLFKGAFRS